MAEGGNFRKFYSLYRFETHRKSLLCKFPIRMLNILKTFRWKQNRKKNLEKQFAQHDHTECAVKLTTGVGTTYCDAHKKWVVKKTLFIVKQTFHFYCNFRGNLCTDIERRSSDGISLES